MNVYLCIFSSLLKKQQLLLNMLQNMCECVQPVIASIIRQTALLLVATISPNPTHSLYKMSIQCVAAQRMNAIALRSA